MARLVMLGACLAAALAADWLPVEAATDLAALDLRFGRYGANTRVVLELNGPVEAKVQSPKAQSPGSPHRVVVELPELRWAVPSQAPAAAGLVNAARWEKPASGPGRLVLTLNAAAEVREQYVLRPSVDTRWRLVIELAPAAGSRTAVAALPRVKPRIDGAAPGAGKRPVIVLDPGHGGIDPGATGPTGVLEKDLVLGYAMALREALLALGRYDVVLTRDGDLFLPLRERMELAHTVDADLLVSLHVDTEPTHTTRGFSVYTLSETATDAEAAALAAKENKSDIIAGVDLAQYPTEVANILIDFAQAKTNEMSVAFARDYVLEEIAPVTPLLSRPLRSAGFAVLKLPDVPSILVELGYLSHPAEEKALLRADHRRQLGAAAARAIDRYFTEGRQARRP